MFKSSLWGNHSLINSVFPIRKSGCCYLKAHTHTPVPRGLVLHFEDRFTRLLSPVLLYLSLKIGKRQNNEWHFDFSAKPHSQNAVCWFPLSTVKLIDDFAPQVWEVVIRLPHKQPPGRGIGSHISYVSVEHQRPPYPPRTGGAQRIKSS